MRGLPGGLAHGWRVYGRAVIRPEVSVVVATRNRWPLLARCALPSVHAQEDVDLELIVVDDGALG